MNNTMNKSSFKNQTFATRLSKIDNNSSKPQTKNSNKKYQLNNDYNDKRKQNNNIKRQSKIESKNNLLKKKSSNEHFSEQNDRTNEDEISRPNKNIVTTIVQIDDLTKIPDRIGGAQNKYADYDYNEAKRAAVTCRRIEYSYNLRNVIKSEICLDEIVMIQRWWRDI